MVFVGFFIILISRVIHIYLFNRKKNDRVFSRDSDRLQGHNHSDPNRNMANLAEEELRKRDKLRFDFRKKYGIDLALDECTSRVQESLHVAGSKMYFSPSLFAKSPPDVKSSHSHATSSGFNWKLDQQTSGENYDSTLTRLRLNDLRVNAQDFTLARYSRYFSNRRNLDQEILPESNKNDFSMMYSTEDELTQINSKELVDSTLINQYRRQENTLDREQRPQQQDSQQSNSGHFHISRKERLERFRLSYKVNDDWDDERSVIDRSPVLRRPEKNGKFDFVAPRKSPCDTFYQSAFDDSSLGKHSVRDGRHETVLLPSDRELHESSSGNYVIDISPQLQSRLSPINDGKESPEFMPDGYVIAVDPKGRNEMFSAFVTDTDAGGVIRKGNSRKTTPANFKPRKSLHQNFDPSFLDDSSSVKKVERERIYKERLKRVAELRQKVLYPSSFSTKIKDLDSTSLSYSHEIDGSKTPYSLDV